MRIVQVTESLEIGGAERVVVSLANALANKHESSVICLKREGQLAATLSGKVKLACLDKKEGNDPCAALRLAGLLRAARADVIHTHDWGVFLDALLGARLANVPGAVHTVHGEYMAYAPGLVSSAKKRLRHWLERLAARKVDVVCVSDALRAHVAHEVGLPEKALHTIANGIPVGGLAPKSPRAPGQPFRFIAVGRLAAVKNFGMLLDAFARVAATRSDVLLRLVGDGPERAALERSAARLGIRERVEFTGFRSDTDVLLSEADAFVLSSRSEGIPMSILEAMRAGLPVLATRVGGVPTVVVDGRTGILVEVDDVDSMAGAMEHLVTHPEAARALAEAGYERVRSHFSIDAMLESYERLYQAQAPAAVPSRGGQLL